MDQIKIGKFIAEIRKEKNMTQKDLAEKLGITDRAVSKWENGRGLPDLSLLKPLCDVFEISINELLSAERMDKETDCGIFEENIINTIDYTEKKIRKNKRIYIIILTVILSFVTVFAFMFAVDINRMRNSRPVVFSTWGYKYTPPRVDIHEAEIEYAIKDFLVNKGDNERKHHNGEKSFASIKIYLIESDEGKIYDVYAWVCEEKYYFENNEIKKESGSSLPYKFTVKRQNDEYLVSEAVFPGDGSKYSDDMKEIFPYSVRKDMEKCQEDGTVAKLESDIKQQSELYFHK